MRIAINQVIILSIIVMATKGCTKTKVHADSDIDGVYVTCSECEEHWREVIQLSKGKFKYWYWTKNMDSAPSKGPATGTFKVSGDWLEFSEGAPKPLLRFTRLKQTRVLITEEGVQTWNAVQKLYPPTGYFVVSGALKDPDKITRPSFVEFNAK